MCESAGVKDGRSFSLAPGAFDKNSSAAADMQDEE
jgi:hypothetical protein